MLPGGPGLSCQYLKKMADYLSDRDLYFVDPAGSGSTKDLDTASFPLMIKDLSELLEDFSSPKILIGHSFGGFYAAGLALQSHLNTKGLVTICTPFSNLARRHFMKVILNGVAKNFIT